MKLDKLLKRGVLSLSVLLSMSGSVNIYANDFAAKTPHTRGTVSCAVLAACICALFDDGDYARCFEHEYAECMGVSHSKPIVAKPPCSASNPCEPA